MHSQSKPTEKSWVSWITFYQSIKNPVIIIGRDFNIDLDHSKTPLSDTLRQFNIKHNIRESYRYINEDQLLYPGHTFESPDINKNNTCIEYIFALDSLIGPQSKIELIEQAECDTDHNSLILNNHTLPRSPPQWKFTDNLLKSESFCQNLCQNIQSVLHS